MALALPRCLDKELAGSRCGLDLLERHWLNQLKTWTALFLAQTGYWTETVAPATNWCTVEQGMCDALDWYPAQLLNDVAIAVSA